MKSINAHSRTIHPQELPIRYIFRVNNRNSGLYRTVRWSARNHGSNCSSTSLRWHYKRMMWLLPVVAFLMEMVTDDLAQNVAVSLGSHGAFLVTREGVLRAPAQLVKVHSAVGAGDSFVGAMVYSLSQGEPIATAFRYGLAGGAAAVMTAGDQLCNAQDVKSLYCAMADPGS